LAYHALYAPQRQDDEAGVTIAIAIVLRVRSLPSTIQVERWIDQIDEAVLPVFDADETTPMGVAIRATERTDKQTTASLVLDSAVDCARHFERSKDERPVRTIAEFAVKAGRVAN